MEIKSNHLIKSPIVSVVLPCYNRVNTVSQTLESIIQQKANFDFEIVIGDDFSTDNVRKVLLEYQKKYPEIIVLIFHDKNIGLCANWATCVKHCRGKYIANCDNDDYWHNNEKLQLQIDFLESHLEYGVCHTNYRNHNRESGKITEIVVSNDTFDISLQKAIFTGKFRCCNATIMYRKELIDKYINLDDYVKYQFTLQDWNTWIILAKYTDFYCLPISTATFGIETESITRPKRYDKLINRFINEKVMYKYLCNLFPEDLQYDEKGYDIYVNGVLLSLAFKKNDFKQAKVFASYMLELGDKTQRTKLASYWIGFHFFRILKGLKQKN